MTFGIGAESVGVRHDAGLVRVGWNQAGGEKEVVKSWEKWEAMLKINHCRCDGRLIPYPAGSIYVSQCCAFCCSNVAAVFDLESRTLLWIICAFATFGHRKVNDQ